MKATIFDIQRNSFVDGPGIRTTVFFKGCNLRCKWCHSPESQAPHAQMMFYKNKCVGCGKCRDACVSHFDQCTLCGKCTLLCTQNARQISGKEYTVDAVMDEIIKDRVFYLTSGGGVTFSGGECMLQIEFLEEILKRCKTAGIHTAVDTAGNVPWASFEKLLPYTDLFLYDVKAVTEPLHIEGTGVSNKLILDNLRRLSSLFEGQITIRIPVISGFNASFDEMKKINSFLRGVHSNDIELLPYHAMGEHKYDALNMPFTAYQQPDEDRMEAFRQILNNK